MKVNEEDMQTLLSNGCIGIAEGANMPITAEEFIKGENLEKIAIPVGEETRPRSQRPNPPRQSL